MLGRQLFGAATQTAAEAQLEVGGAGCPPSSAAGSDNIPELGGRLVAGLKDRRNSCELQGSSFWAAAEPAVQLHEHCSCTGNHLSRPHRNI